VGRRLDVNVVNVTIKPALELKPMTIDRHSIWFAPPSTDARYEEFNQDGAPFVFRSSWPARARAREDELWSLCLPPREQLYNRYCSNKHTPAAQFLCEYGDDVWEWTWVDELGADRFPRSAPGDRGDDVEAGFYESEAAFAYLD
jgi:hypothetical protein